ncbi:hypothetical protein HPB51_005168 [Rhipicephalus microplus]|uniref:Uncharacterized protein n=1 Tax=Rhipicephalus microplus TaxID=6941 RepID=A0A9J6DLB6_RHIMP|nr:hypothetical protein HPB51_005168 [Rhipicephalus microplus]
MVERKSCLPESTEIPSAEHSKTQQHVASQTPAEDQGAVVPVDGAQLHFAPNDAAEMQPGGSVVEKTSAAVSPHTAKPLVTYLRNAQHRHPSQTEREATPAAVATPLSSLLAKAVPRRHGKNSKVWRELTVSSSEFDFPSELPLPKLSSRRDQRDSQSGTRGKEHNAGANNSKTPAVRTEASSHEKATFTFDGKLQKHARQKSGAEEVTPNEPGRVRDNVKLPKAANVVTPAWFDVPSDACPPPPVQDQTMNLAESRKVKSEEALFPPSDREDGIVRQSSGTGTTRPRYPEVFSSYSSESLRKLASSRERRGALAPTHDQLQNLYKTLMMAQHPPRRERLSREAFSKKFFIPKGTKIDFPPPGLPGHPAGSSSSMARMKASGVGVQMTLVIFHKALNINSTIIK